MLTKEPSFFAVLLGGALAACFLTANAFADEEAYIDNWPGNLRIELASPDLPEAIVLPSEQAGPSLSELLHRAWAENAPRICDQLRAGFEEGGGVREWQRCELTAAGELRGRAPPLFPNRLDLKYIIDGNRVQFVAPTPSVLGSWADPIIEARFSVVIRLTVLFDTKLDLVQPASDGPIRLVSGHTGFSKVQFRSSWDSIPVADDEIAPSLREGEIKLGDRVESLLPETLPLGAMNRLLRGGASALKAALENQDTSIPYLGLRASIKEDDLVLVFSKGSRPAVALSMCSCQSTCEDQIHCTCGGAGILQENERVLLQLLKAGAWTPSGVSDRGSWSVDGDPLGATNGEELTARVCTLNQWGRICGAQFAVVYRDIGACSAPDPTPTPICPNGMRPCPGHGCITSDMTCTPER